MFSFFKRHQNHILLEEGSTAIFTERDFFDHFARDISNATTTVIIESPYLTTRRTKQFVKLLKRKNLEGVRILIYTRHPSYHDKLLELESWKSLRILNEAGIKVYLCNDMRHRKIGLIDNRITWTGSLNILSQNKSKEIMIRMYDKRINMRMKAVVNK